MPIDDTIREEIKKVVDDVKEYMRYYREMGYDPLPFHGNCDNIEGERPFSRPRSLRDVMDMIGECQRCRLHLERKNIVFGVGRENSRLIFIGEAPGMEEDIQGRPFVGKAGQLLTKIINAMGMKREDLYITNVVKCRPPQNRDPQPDEIAQCEPFLRYQVDIIRPDIICALGRFAVQTLLKTNESLSLLRGRFHNYNGIKVMPTFHPAYLLRNPQNKRLTWKDMQMVMEELNQIQISRRVEK